MASHGMGRVKSPFLANKSLEITKLCINLQNQLKIGGEIMLTIILYLLCTIAFLPEAFNQKK